MSATKASRASHSVDERAVGEGRLENQLNQTPMGKRAFLSGSGSDPASLGTGTELAGDECSVENQKI